MKKYLYAAITASVFTLIFLLLPGYYDSSEGFQKASLQTRDLFFRIRRWSTPPSDKIKDIVIVTIDEESCEKLESRWPWSRRVFADLLNHLYDGGAKAVGLNVSFTGLESGDAESTDILAEAMRTSGNVVVGATFNKDNGVVKPSPAIAQSVYGYGYLEKIIDPDLVLRRSYVVRPYEKSNQFESSFPLRLAEAYAGGVQEARAAFDRDLGQITVGVPHKAVFVDEDGSYVINYTAVESDFKEIPAWQIVQHKFNSSDIEGKMVLVGLTSALFGDRHPTPFGSMAGIIVHANEFLAMESGRNLRFISYTFVFIFAWILGLMVVSFFLFQGLWIGIAAFVVAFVGVFLGTQTLFVKDYIFEPFILLLGPSLALLCGILSNSVQLFLTNKGLETKIVHDKLTGLYNYDYLRERLEEEWKKCKKTRKPLTMVMTDLDRFKKINDTLGHETGNEMIKRAAGVLKASARGYDVVARYGGDEFFVLLWQTSNEEARAYRERLRSAYHAMAHALEDERLHDSSISIGLATFDPAVNPKHPENTQKLLEEADKDLFTDKESRRKPGEARR